MAFKKKTWKDRLVEYSGRRLLKRISGSADSQMVVDVTRNEGTVSQAGDAFSAANMNDLEQRIADAFTEATNSFQAGVDTLYNKCKSCGATPSAKTPTAISTSIQSIYTNRYNAGVAAGKVQNVTVKRVSWKPYDNNVLSYTVNVGAGRELYKTLFPVYRQGGQVQGGIDSEFTISYGYNATTGILTISVPNKYTTGNTQVFDIYTIN